MQTDPRFLVSKLALPILHRMDAERAHRLAIKAMQWGLTPTDRVNDPILATNVAGLRFANPLGIGAGFDKNAVAVHPLSRLGFGFVEVGTVTPLPQKGNPAPRLFRLLEDRAVVNRMGFNNAGMQAALKQLNALPSPGQRLAPVGVNIGINKEGADPERDYPLLMRNLAPLADYMVINVSSPNTPGLRDLQSEERLRAILQAIAAAMTTRPPLFLKLAPDLADAGLEAAVGTAMDAGLDGLVISNTTIDRPASLQSPHARQTGGLSGAPLFARSTEMLRRAYRQTAGSMVLIGVGGIASGRDALEKIRAGASLVQLYSSFVLQGAPLVPRIKNELACLLREQGFASIQEAIGTEDIAR